VSKKLSLTLACGNYEITRALLDGTVKPDGIDLTVATRMDSSTRQWRFLQNREFDMAETSAGSHIVGVGQGRPLTALPVFLHRRFRHGFVFVNTSKGIKTPKDLIGKRIGVKNFMVTAIVWMRGILEQDYGVPRDSVEWVTEIDEDIAFENVRGFNITRGKDDRYMDDLLVDGEIDALMHPDLIDPILNRDPRVGRLFPDYKQEEIYYYKKTGIFPIMHVLGIKPEIVQKYPWVPINMFHAFNEAKAIAMKRMVNPRIVPLAWYREAWEEQEDLLGHDPWEHGLTDNNRHNFGTLVDFAYKDGVLSRPMDSDEFFTPVFQGRKRGEEFRM
jgi:4,5-dihydroxyphthalate decarboxylase